MAEKSVMAEAGRATGEHPFEERYRLERDIQLKGAKDPENFKVGDRTLAEIQKANQEIQEKEGEKQAEAFRESMRDQSNLSVTGGEKVVSNKFGILLDTTEPSLPDDVTVDQAHQASRPRTQSETSETRQGPNNSQSTGGAGGQTGAGSTGPGGTNTSGTGTTGSGGTSGGTT